MLGVKVGKSEVLFYSLTTKLLNDDSQSAVGRFSVLTPALQIFLLKEFGLPVCFENTKNTGNRKINHFDPFWTSYDLQIQNLC